VQLAGSAHDPEAAEDYASSAPYGGVFWLGRGELYVSESLALTLDLEIGAVTLPVSALVPPDRAIFEIDGAWFTTGIGLALEL
jgi:hypothetical protein